LKNQRWMGVCAISPSHQLHRQDRIATELEEPVVHPYPLDLEDLAEEAREARL
jgi:hypothetical protein